MYRRTIRLTVVGIAAAVANSTVRTALPLVAGNFSIAQEFLHGDAHVMIMGDSEQTGLYGLYTSTWKIDKWSGITAGPNLGSTFDGDTGVFNFGFSGPYIASETGELADSTNPIVAGQTPAVTEVVTFAQQPASTGGNLLSNRLFEVDVEPNQENIYHGGSWDDLGTGTLHADAIFWQIHRGFHRGCNISFAAAQATRRSQAHPSARSRPQPG